MADYSMWQTLLPALAAGFLLRFITTISRRHLKRKFAGFWLKSFLGWIWSV